MPRSHNNSPRPMTSSCFAFFLLCQDNEMRGLWFLVGLAGHLGRDVDRCSGKTRMPHGKVHCPPRAGFYCELRLHVSAGCTREPCGYIASAIFRSRRGGRVA